MSTVIEEPAAAAGVPSMPLSAEAKTEGSKTRAEAAVENSLLSTGPKTEAGKAVSAMNAVKHGARATRVVLPGEDAEGFEALKEALHGSYEPQTAKEKELVEEVAALEWKRQRLERLEWEFWARALKPRADGTVSETPMADAFCLYHKELSLLLRYMSGNNRKLEKTRKELQELIKGRKMAAAMRTNWAERMAEMAKEVEEEAEEETPIVVTPVRPFGSQAQAAGTPVVAQARPAQRNSQFLPNRGRR